MQKKAPADITPFDDPEASHEMISFQKIISKLLSLWPWLILSVSVSLAIAVFYFKTSPRQYKIRASVLVQDDKKSSELGGASILQDFGLLGGKSNVDNEAEIFKSRTLMEQVVRNLQLNIHYFIPGQLQNTEIYTESPVVLTIIKATDSFPGNSLSYHLEFDKTNPTNFTLSNEHTRLKGHFGDTLNLSEGTAVINPSKGFGRWPVEQRLEITIGSIDGTTQGYMASLTVDIPNDEVSVIYLTLTETLPEKGQKILNALINTYLQANVNDKNRIADSTMKFIDERLSLVSSELSGIEKDIEGFKTKNKLTDLTEQSRILLDNTSEFSKQQTTQEVQLSVIEALEQFLKSNQNNARIVPSSLVMQDPSFVALVQRYNEMQLERDKMLLSHTPQHPSVLSLDEQLVNMRGELLSSINSVKQGFNVSISELKKRNNGVEGMISKVPSKERIFLDYSRQQAIKQELYLFLLKKQEETAISKSSTLANARIIDMAKAESSPFKPKKSMIMMTAFLIGMLIPLVISFGKDYFNNRVNSIEDINALTSAPVLAEIGHNNEKDVVTISLRSRQLIAEQLRSLRTNLQYLLPGEHEKTILVTSSMSGEGKSFLSINLSAALALAGKKVILLELDLRKPKITENLNLRKTGFSNYIISNDDNWLQWTQPSGVDDNFTVLPSGPLPPNPTELLMLPKTQQLFEELKKHYDYILIDSPPVGLVTDAEIMASHADATLYVVRHRLTYKQQITLIEKFNRKKVMPKINIIVNDVLLKKRGYGYGYSYGYGYGAYESDVKKERKTAKKVAVR
ncbi:MAG: polysaccharide biosynthesis tyrosine autokinase [Niastella sp.]|nr:polysaccharide biosynthesis tyrosine autokinase [Niastella sp.]